MAEDINLNKEVFNKRAYTKTIDVTFNELGIQTVQQQLDQQPTVQEFFNMYNELFYQINQFGPTESHEYLVKTSGEYISFEERDELINALQQEIATLRTQLLEAENNLANATLGGEEEIPTLEEVEIEPIENPISNTINVPLEDPPIPPQDPDIRYGKLRKNLQTLFDKGELKNNNINGPKRDLKQAFKKERNEKNPRKFNQWKKDIKNRSSNKDKDDLLEVLEKTRDNLREGGNGEL